VVDTVCQGDLLFPARPHGVTLQNTVNSTIIYVISNHFQSKNSSIIAYLDITIVNNSKFTRK